jgi:NADPH-dependent 2,4-dienoyl-CoA reductase/sulfur reductase-like enzyme
MEKVKYLIVGGGMAGDSAVRGIRSLDPTGSICLITEEAVGPYNRPPLSKGLWAGKSIEKIWRKTEKQNVDMVLSTRVENINPAYKSVKTDKGEIITFEKALLATGTTPRRFPFAGELVNYFRYLKDYEDLRELTSKKDEFVIIGGGFIGSELAASLSGLGKKVSIVFPENWLNQRIFPAEVSAHLHEVFDQHGINILTGISIADIEEKSGKNVVTIKKADGDILSLSADGVIAGLGVIPNTALAEESNLPTGNGITVDSTFRTAHQDIYAAGDVANFPDTFLFKNRRVEHEDHANASGILAGKNMAGANESYAYLPYFYSDLFDIGYEAVGDLDSSLEVTLDWVEPFKKGVFYYQRDAKVVGVLLWNTWGKLDQARAIIAENKGANKSYLIGRII